ncbi:MAG TPA: hypothetical protein VF275_05180 [Gammaproteobacteria bacterium]
MTAIAQDSRHWLPENAAIASMDSHRIVKVAGPDALEFLQGQFSNDIAALNENPGQLSSYNNPKGRVLAFLRVLKHRDEYWLVVDAGIVDAFLQRLRMFVLRSKLTVETADELRGVVVAGADAARELADRNLPAPGAGESVVKDDCVFLGLPGPAPRVEIYGPKDALPPLDLATATQDDLARWDVLFKLPRITDANRDAHVAQHLDLDELGAINFKKGCYTGQEIIARMKYLGKVKKRTSVFLGDGANVGDALRTEDGRSVGEVVNVAVANEQQLVLAVVNLDDRDKILAVNEHPLERLS